MSVYVNNECKSALLSRQKIGKMRSYMNQKSSEKLVHAFVTSKLDVCNSLLFGLPQRELVKFQWVQNIAARIVIRVPHHEHITPILECLHWPPLKQRVDYKILMITYKAFNRMAPIFISDLLPVYQPSRTLKFSSLTVVNCYTNLLLPLLNYGKSSRQNTLSPFF